MKVLDKAKLLQLLDRVKTSDLSVSDALEALSTFMEGEVEGAVLDHQRALRVGFGEVVYGEGKTPTQLADICGHMAQRDCGVLVTRVSPEGYEAIAARVPAAQYNPLGRTVTVRGTETATDNPEPMADKGYIAIVAAGTSDLPVVEEAYETARFYGNRVEKVVDVGVAGIHRLFKRLDIIRGARVVIVVAGMEGALASVVGGLVDKPIIAVPTSVGYGASFNGLSALLTMLNSCASGVSVVNIDNGFGAAYCACQINRL